MRGYARSLRHTSPGVLTGAVALEELQAVRRVAPASGTVVEVQTVRQGLGVVLGPRHAARGLRADARENRGAFVRDVRVLVSGGQQRHDLRQHLVWADHGTTSKRATV